MNMLDFEILQNVSYIVASALFIIGIKRLGKESTAVSGNFMSACGMFIAVAATAVPFVPETEKRDGEDEIGGDGVDDSEMEGSRNIEEPIADASTAEANTDPTPPPRWSMKLNLDTVNNRVELLVDRWYSHLLFTTLILLHYSF